MRSEDSARLDGRWLSLVQQHPRMFLSVVTLLTRIPALLAMLTHHLHAFASEGNDGYVQIAQNVVSRGIIGLDTHHLLTRGPFPLILVPGILIQHPVVWTLVVNLVASVGICLLVFEACLLWSRSILAASAATFLVLANPWLIWCVKNPTPVVTGTFSRHSRATCSPGSPFRLPVRCWGSACFWRGLRSSRARPSCTHRPHCRIQRGIASDSLAKTNDASDSRLGSSLDWFCRMYRTL